METRRVEEEARRRAAALEEEEAGRKKQLEEAKLAAEKARFETEAAKRREEEANAEMVRFYFHFHTGDYTDGTCVLFPGSHSRGAGEVRGGGASFAGGG